jgi:MFS superfamily sulfate permease-like transporter
MSIKGVGLFSDFSTNFKSDIVSGFVIFLIALPLSLGIALASGAPATAGVLAAILGGIVGTLFSGTHVAISGPAAGLIVVVLHSIQSLGQGDAMAGFKRMLACVIIAGALQIVFGLLRAGSLAFLCPSSVVHGMLAAIGVIIMVKQLPVLIGVIPHAKSIIGIVEELPADMVDMNLPIAAIGLFCFLLVIAWNAAPKKYNKWVPAPLLAIFSGICLGLLFHLDTPHSANLFHHVYAVGPQFLVNLPGNIAGMIIFPDFSQILSAASVIAVVSIFLVGSLESVLSAYAVDKIDPQRRKSDLNKELIGKGVVNMCCGFLGALPVISEIVRSSANIANGAKSKWSNFFHGVFILLFVALFPSLLKEIPLAALAAVLILVGFRLAHPKQLGQVYEHGKDQFAIFMATMILTLVEDLLVGIFAGIVLNVLLHLVKGVKASDFFLPKFEVIEELEQVTIRANSPVIFTNYLAFKKLINAVPHEKELVIDLRRASVVDFTFLEHAKEMAKNFNELERGCTLHLPEKLASH